MSNEEVEQITEGLREVARKFFDFQRLNRFVIDSYNHFTSFGIPKILERSAFNYETTTKIGRVSFVNPFLLPPFKSSFALKGYLEEQGFKPGEGNTKGEGLTVPEFVRQMRQNWLTAQDCRDDKKSFMLSVYADIVIVERSKSLAAGKIFDENTNERLVDSVLKMLFNETSEEEQSRTFQFVKLFDIPLMTGSQFDWLIFSGVPAEEYSIFGECMYDPFASFVIKGKNKFFVTQEKLAPGVARCIVENKELTCTFRSESLEKRSVNVVIMFSKDKEEKKCTIYLPVLLQKKSANEKKKMSDFNVLNIFRCYAIWALRQIQLRENNNAKLRNEQPRQIPSRVTSLSILQGDLDYYLGQVTTNSDTYREVVKSLIYTLVDIKSIQSDKDFIESIASVKDKSGTKDKQSTSFHLPASFSYEAKVDSIKRTLDEELFPHITVTPETDYFIDINFETGDVRRPYPFARFFTLVDMIVTFVKTNNQMKGVFDRDSFSTKVLASAGFELATLVEKAFVKATRKFKFHNLDNGINSENIASNLTRIAQKMVTGPIQTSFSTGNWGLTRTKARTGVVQQEDPASLMAKWELIRKLSIPVSSKSKLQLPRLVQSTGYGIVDPTKTVDNEKAGLIKYLAVSVYVSNNDINSEIYANQLVHDLYLDSKMAVEKDDLFRTPLFINRVWKGFAKKAAFETFREEKLRGRIGYYCEVFENVEIDQMEVRREYHIVTTGGRAMRPVFRVENNSLPKFRIDQGDTRYDMFDSFDVDIRVGELTVTERYVYGTDVMSSRSIPRFEELLRKGIVQYVSSNESEFSNIAMDFSQLLRERGTKKFDYLEIDPYFALALSGTTQPDAAMNPVPRVMYYGLMSHQPMGLPLTTIMLKQETEVKVLHYSQKPLISTDTINAIGLDQLGYGINVTVFVMSYHGTDEDATIWKKEFFERGGFNASIFETFEETVSGLVPDTKDDFSRYANGVVTTTIRTEEEIDPAEREVLGITSGSTIGGGNYDEEEEEEQGGEQDEDTEDDSDVEETVRIEEEWPFNNKLPKMSGRSNLVRPKDVLFRYKNSHSNDADIREVTLKGTMAGFVHSTHRVNAAAGGIEKIQKVVVRFPHFPGVGDKFANRFAQKGVIGAVLPEVELPRTQLGLTPDVIFSPTSLTSRMTVGMLSEILRGKAAIACNRTHFVNIMVNFPLGAEKPTIKKDFYILLEEIMVLVDPSSNRQQQFARLEDIVKKAKKVHAKGDNVLSWDSMNDDARNEFVDNYIGENYPEGIWSREYGMKIVMEQVKRGGVVVGERVKYDVPKDKKKIATLKTGEKGILFSQLDPNRQFDYFKKNESHIIPTYRIPSARDMSKDEKRLRDATPFRPMSSEEIGAILAEKGYSRDGKQEVYDGKTGEVSEALIYSGPCYWMALKHIVAKKEQVRDQGNISLSTRAPSKGRSVGGAVKKEEMQRVAALAHGSNRFLQEAFLTAADEYEGVACRKCGKWCYVSQDGTNARCDTCGVNKDPYKVTAPWSTIRFSSVMEAAGVSIKRIIEPIDIEEEELILESADEANIYKIEDDE